MVWLKRRWSPLKENRLQTLIDDGGVKGVWLLERYLGEQTRGLEDEQAELIKREALGDSSAPLPHFPQGRSSDADAPHIAPRAEARAGRHHSPDRLVDGAHWGAPSQAHATPDETAAAHGAAVKDIVVVRSSWGGYPPSPTTSSPRSAATLGEALCASVRAHACTQAGVYASAFMHVSAYRSAKTLGLSASVRAQMLKRAPLSNAYICAYLSVCMRTRACAR